MVRFKKVPGERSSRAIKRRRIPAHPQELAVSFVPRSTLAAGAKLNSQFVPTVDVDHEEFMWG